MTEDRGQMTEEIGKKKKTISRLKKIFLVLIAAPFIPLLCFLGLLASGAMSSDGTTVDKRFALSSSMKSPYGDTAKGSYNYTFAFCGDPHMQSEGDGFFPELDQALRDNHAGFVVFGGDLTFLGRESEYKNFVEHVNALTVPAYPALGNHDLYNEGWESYWQYLGPSAYSFCGGNARFIVIDTASGELGEKQMEWIRKELKANRQPLLFVVSHMPIYGGQHGLDEFPRTQERETLIELFEKYEVDYVLEGHRHAFINIAANNVRYVTSGSFSEGLLDAGVRHFLLFRVYGPNVNIEQVIVGKDIPIQYKDEEIEI